MVSPCLNLRLYLTPRVLLFLFFIKMFISPSNCLWGSLVSKRNRKGWQRYLWLHHRPQRLVLFSLRDLLANCHPSGLFLSKRSQVWMLSLTKCCRGDEVVRKASSLDTSLHLPFSPFTVCFSDCAEPTPARARCQSSPPALSFSSLPYRLHSFSSASCCT